MIRLVIADVDGTLVTQEKVLTKDAIAAAQELRDAGITLALTSGRPPRGMQMLIEPLQLEGQIAGFNGGVYVNPGYERGRDASPGARGREGSDAAHPRQRDSTPGSTRRTNGWCARRTHPMWRARPGR